MRRANQQRAEPQSANQQRACRYGQNGMTQLSRPHSRKRAAFSTLSTKIHAAKATNSTRTVCLAYLFFSNSANDPASPRSSTPTTLDMPARKRSHSSLKSRENPKKLRPLRSGKWTYEEELFAHRLIEDFENGQLEDCDDGCTLRAFLAQKLRCAPMRISKKFAGRCIGKVRNWLLCPSSLECFSFFRVWGMRFVLFFWSLVN